MNKTGIIILAAGFATVALVAVACRDSTRPTTALPDRPRADASCGGSGGCPPPPSCTPGKWTGGGRIDPTGDHTAANYDNADEQDGGQPVGPDPAPFMTGKVTFGFNVFLGTECSVTKGEIEVNGHEILVNGQTFKLAWHVSIHGGFDTFGTNEQVFAQTFGDQSGGMCLVVGVPFPPGMTARVNPQGGTEEVQFEVCDNDRGGAQSGRINGSQFHVDAMRWRTTNHGDTGLTYLTGGNVVDHS